MNRPDFPRGLVQPPGSYRFGQDALLLGAFAASVMAAWRERKKNPPPSVECLEPGCGCGAASFAFLLLFPHASCLGLDAEEPLIEAARENSRLLALQGKTSFMACNLSQIPQSWQNRFQLILANPPWRSGKSGKMPSSSMRRRALFASDETLRLFYGFGSRLAKAGGYMVSIIPANLLCEVLAAIAQSALGLRRILPICGHASQNPGRLLLLCQKGAASDPVLLNPLVLYSRDGSRLAPTSQALEFCPWL